MSEHFQWTQYFLAMIVLAGLLGLFGLFALAVQRGWLLQQWTGLTRFRPSERRMKITETLVIDPRRRVVILRIDDEERVILMGVQEETVLKAGEAPVEMPPETLTETMTETKADTVTASVEEGKAS